MYLTEGVRGGGGERYLLEMDSVEANEAICGSEPQESITGLCDGVDCRGGEPVTMAPPADGILGTDGGYKKGYSGGKESSGSEHVQGKE
jgi:hypothetical protein